MANVLLTGGRAPAALELARIFEAAGHRVYMAEIVRGHLSEPSKAIAQNFIMPPPRQETAAYIDALKQVITEHQIDLLVPTCEEIFHIARGWNVLSQHCIVFAVPIERLRPLHHKYMFVCKAADYGLAVPETILLKSARDTGHAFDRWDELVLKPAYSRFASKTLIRPTREAAANIDVSAESPWVAQRYIEGEQLCTYSVVHLGRITAHTAYRSEFTAGQGATIVFQHVDHPASLAWVQRFVEAEQFTGQIAFDFIETADGEVVAIECNPRAISGVHLFAKTPEFAQAFFDASLACVTPADDVCAMLLTGMLVYGLPSSIRDRRFKRWLFTFLRSRDVIANLRDPLPALLQLRSIVHYVVLGRKHGISALEASTLDIEWNGEMNDL
jgi:predicted ATP-grasp superfamily ATP-dependent carboligase